MANSAYETQCREIAARFLQTAIVVDDAAWNGPGTADTPHSGLRVPGNKIHARTESSFAEREPTLPPLDAEQLVNAFARRGIVCSAIAPEGAGKSEAVEGSGILNAAKRADVVILDWQMPYDGRRALKILELLEQRDGAGRLRIIVIYTGRSNLMGIKKRIMDQMPWREDENVDAPRIRSEGLHVFIYAKQATPLADELADLELRESELPERLIRDFARDVGGLLPNLVMASLTSVRENSYRILNGFDRSLDPAFLTHRACLNNAEDGDKHVVDQLVNELRAVMVEKAYGGDLTNADAVKGRITEMWDTTPEITVAEAGRTLRRKDAVCMAESSYGELEGQPWGNAMGKNKAKMAFKWLTRVFGGDENDISVDLEFSHLMTSRSVGPEPPTLHLGSLLIEEGEKNGEKENGEREKEFLLCMTPLCDSVRLQERTNFLFVPVRGDQGPNQIVIRDGNQLWRKRVQMKSGDWRLLCFKPDNGMVRASKSADGKTWHFKAESDAGVSKSFRWLGELRQEVAQDLAHTVGGTLSRVATDTPEWLRRYERI